MKPCWPTACAGDPARPIVLVQVTTPPEVPKPFCAGLVFAGPLCTEAAPILGWAEGKTWAEIRRYGAKRRWRLEVVRP